MKSKDAIIVGSGPSGIAVATTLAEQNVNCTILEAGNICTIPPNINSTEEYRKIMAEHTTVDEKIWQYGVNGINYSRTRVRASGGRALVWGGWAIRPHPDNWLDAELWERSWPFSYEVFSKLLDRSLIYLNARKLEKTFNYTNIEKELGLIVNSKVAALSPDLKRPFHPKDRWGKLTNQLRIIPNAICTKVLTKNGKCVGVEYIDYLSHKTFQLFSKTVVLSASPIETSRILLSSNLDSPSANLIGKGFTDHIISGYMVVIPRTAEIKKHLEKKGNVGYIPRISSKQKKFCGGYSIEVHGPSSFEILDDPTFQLTGLNKEESEKNACFLIFVIGVSSPDKVKKITLDNHKKDSLGRFIPIINFDWSKEDYDIAKAMDFTGNEIAETLSREYEGKIYKINTTLSFDDAMASHESGTCPIGKDPKLSVVGADGQVHGVPGLSLADASLLPTGLDCHPTLSIVALALNTADHIAAKFQRGEL